MTDPTHEPTQRTAASATDPCRTCRTPITRDVKSFPFCSERCRLADLGAWFDEKYTISRPIQESDLLDT